MHSAAASGMTATNLQYRDAKIRPWGKRNSYRMSGRGLRTQLALASANWLKLRSQMRRGHCGGDGAPEDADHLISGDVAQPVSEHIGDVWNQRWQEHLKQFDGWSDNDQNKESQPTDRNSKG